MLGLIWTYITLARYTLYYFFLSPSHFFTLTRIAVMTYCVVLVGLNLYLDNSATVCDTFYCPDQQSTTYIYVYNILYIVNTPTCFDAPALSSESLILLLC
jgi:hypothetical protein